MVLGVLLALAGCAASVDEPDEPDEHDLSSMEPGIATVGGGPDTPYRGLAPTEPFPRPAFTLTDTDGAPYDFMADTGLTGDQAAVEAAQLEAGVPVAADNGETHSTLLLLYGRDDLARVAFLAGSVPDDITHDLEIIARE